MLMSFDVDLEEVAASISREEADTLIKNIDRCQEDWDFTKKMALYFLGELYDLYELDTTAGSLDDLVKSVLKNKKGYTK